uniref:Cytochrome c oxidase subunit 2 n=1 Tax=Pseudoligosita yasumatsui TaxID=3067466 RepID=A0AA49QEF1_9HYME|nr:cytochrome c oxidase subunit II [Pseudoligosita yasumatsui]WLF85667.1 cytochrome c oxidase subunit 2 [Pseudoligosita yasumatsui]
MSMWAQINLQDSNSLIMENMLLFHDYAMMIIIMIVVMIAYMLVFMFINKLINVNLLEGQMIEIIWTLIPMVFLMFLVIPSLKLLYLTDEMINSMLTIKVLGHQWYWSYEYTDFYMMNFDSFMINNFDDKSLFRLLDVDNHLVIPSNFNIRFLVSSLDVIHSFAMPSLGLKVDSVPGRINQIGIMINRYGLYYGQCSEICGVNHSFMPILIEVTNMKNFLNWVKNF